MTEIIRVTRPTYTSADPIKLAVPVGCCLDISTGSFVEGRNGEYNLLGGLYPSTAIVAGGNVGKSTLAHYLMDTACLRIDYGDIDTSMALYETELNGIMKRYVDLSHQYGFPLDMDIIEIGKLVVTDKSKMWADEFHAQYKELLKAKIAKKMFVDTPFYTKGRAGTYKSLPISLTMYDSASELETSHSGALRDKTGLGDSEQKMLHMQQGLIKYNMFMELPVLLNTGADYLIMTGQYKEDTIQMAAGPHQAPPPKKTPDMKNGDKVKGVPDKFYYLLNNCWRIKSVSNLYPSEGRTNKYPCSSSDDQEDNDLKLMTLVNLRGKGGASGPPEFVMSSQRHGILSAMTEFYNIKERYKNFGISGTNTHYALDLLPDVKLSRTTVRTKLDTIPELRRAMNITSELRQMISCMPEYNHLYCTPKELYDDLKDRYDWNMILSSTRGWYTINNCYNTPIKPLSTLDLLRMRKGLYTPYWLANG